MQELSARTRAEHLAAMAERRLDVLVVGGGITGAGVALDAASRGLSVGLVEREDFAAGTSGRSSRLVHGGARYLRHAELGLVYESLRERELLRRLAPHLVRPLGFLMPIHRFLPRAYLGVGLTIYDALALGRGIAWHRRVPAEEIARLAPTLSRPSRALLTYDCRTDDARLTLEIVRAAAARGALVANHAGVEDLISDGEVRGARIRDRASGAGLEVRARMVINATGVWADRLLGLATPRAPRLRPSKGVHVVLDRNRLPIRCAVTVPSVARDGSMVFAVPWGPRVYAGTTDTPYDGPLERPTVEPGDMAVVLRSLARAFEGDLRHEDVLASWAGVRPLLDTGRGSTRDLSRRHVVAEDPPGLVTVTGGKLTTYRAMAQDVVDHVSRRLRTGGRSGTRRIPLGLTGPLERERDRAGRAAEDLGLSFPAGHRLVDRYGDDWTDAVGLIREDPALGQEVAPGLPVLGVELVLARSREMALTDEDVLVRRTRLLTMDARAGEAVSSRPGPAGAPAGPPPGR